MRRLRITGGVFLQQEHDAEREDEKRQGGDDDAYGDYHGRQHRQEIGCARLVGLVAGYLYGMAAQVVGHGGRAGVADFEYEARHLDFLVGVAEAAVGPAHELLGHGYGVEAGGESHHAACDALLAAIARQRQPQGYSR